MADTETDDRTIIPYRSEDRDAEPWTVYRPVLDYCRERGCEVDGYRGYADIASRHPSSTPDWDNPYVSDPRDPGRISLRGPVRLAELSEHFVFGGHVELKPALPPGRTDVIFDPSAGVAITLHHGG